MIWREDRKYSLQKTLEIIHTSPGAFGINNTDKPECLGNYDLISTNQVQPNQVQPHKLVDVEFPMAASRMVVIK